MARAKAETPAQTVEELLSLETADDVTQALSSVMAETGTEPSEADIQIHVWMLSPDGDAKIGKFAPSEYNLDKIAREQGSGTYRTMIYVRDETGQFRRKVVKDQKYKLGAEAEARLKAIREGTLAPGQTAQSGVTAAEVAKIVQDAIAARATPAPQQIDPMRMLDALAGVVQKIMPANAQPQSPLGGLKEALGVVTDLMRVTRPEGNEERRPNESVSDRFLNRGLETLFAAIEKGNTVQPGQPQPKAAPTAEELEAAEQLEDLRTALRFGVRAAQSGDEPEAFADEWGGEVPLDVIVQMHSDPQFFDRMATVVPQITAHKDWFMKVRARLFDNAVKAGEIDASGKILEPKGDGALDKGTGAGGGG